jgi:hypothetical protein
MEDFEFPAVSAAISRLREIQVPVLGFLALGMLKWYKLRKEISSFEQNVHGTGGILSPSRKGYIDQTCLTSARPARRPGWPSLDDQF